MRQEGAVTYPRDSDLRQDIQCPGQNLNPGPSEEVSLCQGALTTGIINQSFDLLALLTVSVSALGVTYRRKVRMWKEAVGAYFNALTLKLSFRDWVRPSFEPVASRIKARNANNYFAM
jgi:hypothetical protein